MRKHVGPASICITAEDPARVNHGGFQHQACTAAQCGEINLSMKDAQKSENSTGTLCRTMRGQISLMSKNSFKQRELGPETMCYLQNVFVEHLIMKTLNMKPSLFL